MRPSYHTNVNRYLSTPVYRPRATFSKEGAEFNNQFFVQVETYKCKRYGLRTVQSDDPLLWHFQEQLQMASFSLANACDPFHSLVWQIS